METLTVREQLILQLIVHQFILTARPVGSSQVYRNEQVGLSPASVRKIMGKLEDKGLVYQPHTSAGRVPTTAGYRFYVDQLVKMDNVNARHSEKIIETVESFDGDVESLSGKIANVLAQISRQLSIIVSPRFYDGIFDRMQIVPVSLDKVMVIISVKEGQVKTLLLEMHYKIDRRALERVIRKINQRFHGKTLREIKNSFSDVMADLRNEETGLVRLFTNTADRMFDFSRYEYFTLDGTTNIINQPEFSDLGRFATLIELLEDKNIVIHFMEQREIPPGLKVTIGEENAEKQIKDCSVITSTYELGRISGIVGVIGPTRMDYAKMIPLVNLTARLMTKKLN